MTGILVSGGREYLDEPRINNVLTTFHLKYPITRLINGRARGVDTICRNWAVANGVEPEDYPCTPEMWDEYGKAAGHIRNAQMFKLSKPDYAIVFPGGNGTAGMLAILRRADMKVWEIT